TQGFANCHRPFFGQALLLVLEMIAELLATSRSDTCRSLLFLRGFGLAAGWRRGTFGRRSGWSLGGRRRRRSGLLGCFWFFRRFGFFGRLAFFCRLLVLGRFWFLDRGLALGLLLCHLFFSRRGQRAG